MDIKRSSKDRRSSRSRERSRRSRSPDARKRSNRSRSHSRERRHKKRSSRSRDGRRSSRRDSRSRSREARRSSHKKRHSSGSLSDSPGGGYRPRTRKEVAHAPDPAVARTSAFPGPNVSIPTAGPANNQDPFAYLRQKAMPMDPTEALRLWHEQQLQARQVVAAQQAQSGATAASKKQREIFVGNLVAGLVTDAQLRQVFNGALMAAFPGSWLPGMEPVISVSLHSEGRYAFVELRTPDMATAALQLNNAVQLLGQSLVVNRPSGYVDPMKAHQAAQSAAQALAAFKSGDPNAAAALFGRLGMGMPSAAGAMPAGYPSMQPGAMGMPGMPGMPPAMYGAPPAGMYGAPPAGGMYGAPPAGPMFSTAAGVTPAGLTAAMTAAPLAALPLIPAPPPAVVVAGMSVEPTPYLCVLGMVTADVLQGNRDYDDVLEELEDECNRHSSKGVANLKVPRPPADQRGSTDFMGSGDYGKAYVQFQDATGATSARAAIHGRMFAGTTVQVVYVTADAYAAVQGSG